MRDATNSKQNVLLGSYVAESMVATWWQHGGNRNVYIILRDNYNVDKEKTLLYTAID